MRRINHSFFALCGTVLLGNMLLTADPTQAQMRATFYGRALLKDHLPPSRSDDYFIQVWAEYVKDKKPLPIERVQWDLFIYHVACGDDPVRLWFNSLDYYVPAKLDRVFSISKPRDVPVYPATTLAPKIPLKGHKNAQEVSDSLKKQAAFAKATKTNHEFQWFLARMQHTYRNKPNLLAAVENFIQASQNEPFMAAPFQQNRALYAGILKRLSGETTALDSGSLLKLMKTPDVFVGIRTKAIQALAADRSKPPAGEFLEFLRQEAADPSQLLFRPSRSALARIGTAEDKASILKDIGSEDTERVLSAIIAARKAGLMSPDEIIKRLSDNLKEDDDILDAATEPIAEGDIGDIFMGLQISPDYQLVVAPKAEPNAPQWVFAKDGVVECYFPGPGVLPYGAVLITVGPPFEDNERQKRQTKDFSGYTHLVFELRAEFDPNVDKSKLHVAVGIKTNEDLNDGKEKRYDIKSLSTEFVEYAVPLSAFANNPAELAARLERIHVPFEIIFEPTFPRAMVAFKRVRLERRER